MPDVDIPRNREGDGRFQFGAYLDRVQSVVAKGSLIGPTRGERSDQLNAAVKTLEESEEFAALVDNVRHLCNPGFPGAQRAVQTFFRRARIYLDIVHEGLIDREKVFRRFLHDLSDKVVRKRLIAPLDAVYFTKDQIEFEGFAIRRFSASEFRELLEDDVRQVFYSTVDLGGLEEYWWLDLEVEILPTDRDVGRAFVFDRSVPKTFTPFSRELEDVLKVLALWDWEQSEWSGSLSSRPDYKYEGWKGFRIPFVLSVDHNLTTPLFPLPKMRRMETAPVFDEEGVEIHEVQAYSHEIHDTETFVATISRLASAVKRVRSVGVNWTFLDLALAFNLKGYFATDVEQVLWHTAAIESLLGEQRDGQGVLAVLKRRVAVILGRTRNEQKEIRKRLDELYEIRSDLVHGNEGHLSKDVYYGHLFQGRMLARRCLLWTVNYLDFLHGRCGLGDDGLLSRNELLTLVDLDPDSIPRIKKVLAGLPADFPSRFSDM